MQNFIRGVLLVLLTFIWFPLRHSSASAPSQEPLVLKIGEVQGEILDDTEVTDLNFPSPYRGEEVQVSGVVTNLIQIDSSGRKVNLFFLQEAPDASDGNPNTSDAIQVLVGARPELGDSGYRPLIGDMITVRGEVEEYYGLTRLRKVELVSFEGHIDVVNDVIPAIELNPQGTPDQIWRAYERLENMRVFVPANALVVSGTHLYSSSNDTEVFVIRHDHPVAQRDNVFTRRVFRDTHELDDGESGDNWYRISVEPNILKGLANDYEVNLPDYRTYDVFTTPLTGNLVYAFARYTLQIDTLPTVEIGMSPADNMPIEGPDRAVSYTVATFNVENLYDFYDDPFDSQDTPARPTFNYVPMVPEDYETKVNKIALTILESLHAPDIIAFQEIEDQDVCSGGGFIYGTCGDVDHVNNAPDVLEDVALRIADLSNDEVQYVAVTDRDSADDRGISQAFLYRADRVELPTPADDHPLMGARPDDPDAERHEENQEISNPKSLNRALAPATPQFERAPLVGWFRIHRANVGSDDYVDLYFSNNHLKSDPTAFIELREGQANFNVALLKAMQAQDPNVFFIVGGDLNSFPESDEMALLDAELEFLHFQIPAQTRYTYIFQGQTQTLDYLFATTSLTQYLESIKVAHINSDYSYRLGDDPTLPNRAADHDPIVATFRFPE